MKTTQAYIQSLATRTLPDVKVGDTVRVHQRIKEGEKSRIQIFEGIIIARKHGRENGASITVRKISQGVGIERIFPLHLPTVEKIDVTRRTKVRRAKLYYLRDKTNRQTRRKLKTKEIVVPGQESLIEVPEMEVATDATASEGTPLTESAKTKGPMEVVDVTDEAPEKPKETADQQGASENN